VVRIHQLLRQVHFDDADGDCLSPAGEYNLRLGIMKELRPNMVATYNAGVGVFEGNPFVVEAGVSLGGKDVPTVRPDRACQFSWGGARVSPAHQCRCKNRDISAKDPL
jgi:DNA topoisomerase VI subunit B